MIKVHNLTGGYTHSPIIQGLDLEIRRGEFLRSLVQMEVEKRHFLN